MALITSGKDSLALIQAFISSLNFAERKSLITLSRSQTLPELSHSPTLYYKVKAVLDKMVIRPPYDNNGPEEMHEAGQIILKLISSPITTGLVIVLALGMELSDELIEEGQRTSFLKEFMATQTIRRNPEWNWNALLSAPVRGEVIHPLFPDRSPLQRKFSQSLPGFRQSYRYRVIKPHYTTRGVSRQTADHLLMELKENHFPHLQGSRRTIHRYLDRSNVTSKDVIRHYVRTSHFLEGRTEMKQRWYPSGLVPRTYFTWGGRGLAVSSYLRNFFNDLGDTFDPTHRRYRVRPDWLNSSDPEHQGFLFYDLTSFTSWFHEHTPFLNAVADSFRNTPVFLLGPGLSLVEHDLGSLIDQYVETVNEYPEFFISKALSSQFGLDPESTYHHKCAGFLGIPGNLISCTIPHALAISSLHSSETELQVPGDDVGAAYRNRYHLLDHGTCASTLGSLQFDKVFNTPETSVYLKRLVLDLGRSIDLAPMLIYPLLPFLISPDSKPTQKQYRYPERDRIRIRAASVIVSFMRDLWKHTKGEISSSVAEIILIFLRRIHSQVQLPLTAIHQGREFATDTYEDGKGPYSGISVKFSVEDDDCLYENPDFAFADRYVTRMTLREIPHESEIWSGTELQVGEEIIVRSSKDWKFLEDMGYVTILGIAGETYDVIGSDARDAFIYGSKPVYRKVLVNEPVFEDQLRAVGILRDRVQVSFDPIEAARPEAPRFPNSSWRYRRYVDLDDPTLSNYYSRGGKDWDGGGVFLTRNSLSPEPDDISLLY